MSSCENISFSGLWLKSLSANPAAIASGTVPPGRYPLEQKKISFDYEKCIRCYCCLEVCPHGALRTHQPILGKIVARVMNRSF